MTFLSPFLDIIRSDEISGPITCLALNAVNKFVSYGLIGIDHSTSMMFPIFNSNFFFVDYLNESSAATIDKVANAVMHTRFVATNPNDDEVVLMRILQVI